jgi:polyhydroxyalkanoate synthesis regulator phasin
LSHPQANAKQARDAVDPLLQQIKAAIDEENSEKDKEVTNMKEILAMQEQSLAQIIKSGKSQAMQASMTITIEELRSDIEKIEAQTKLNLAIYDDLVLEITAKLEQRLQEVKDKVEIKPFADLQAANLVTDQKVKALEVAND